MQDKGLEIFTAYVRNLIAERAREEYSALVESTGSLPLAATYTSFV